MKITALADLTGVTKSTVRRWCEVYREFLSPTATPPKDATRVFTNTDIRVLYYVATLRDSGVGEPEIIERLKEMQADHWAGLSQLPAEFEEETISVDLAVSKASQLAQVAVLQTELAHKEAELKQARERVEELVAQVKELEGVRGEKHTLEVELAKAEGRVGELEAEIRAYNLAYGFGRGQPISVAVIIGLALLVGVLVVIVSFVVARLIL